MVVLYISIHAPAKGATAAFSASASIKRISIHAPAKGATSDENGMIEIHSISIHAPAKGATQRKNCVDEDLPYFNSRPREGGDGEFVLLKGRCPSFQFTPPRRGRRRGRTLSEPALHFNSRPREGGDVMPLDAGTKLRIFQFTPPRRGRLGFDDPIGVWGEISIHAPAKGATRRAATDRTLPANFNSRPREGGDPL